MEEKGSSMTDGGEYMLVFKRKCERAKRSSPKRLLTEAIPTSEPAS